MMQYNVTYPIIDLERTGRNIRYLRECRGLSVNDVREFMGFDDPQAIYQWQKGTTLPSVDHLCALSKLLNVSMDDILVLETPVTERVGVAEHKTKAPIGQVFSRCLMQVA